MRIFRLFLFLGATVMVAFFGFLYWIWNDISTAKPLAKPTVMIAIPRGTTFDESLALLLRLGVIERTFPIRFYLKIMGGYPMIQAGIYEFHSPLSPLGAMAVLREGAKAERLTVIEGWTRWDIAQAMAKIPALRLKDGKSALPLFNDVSLNADLDTRARDLEG
ncbi:MAG TPA: endolytic transglycosylase MltG, partial [Candidatus Obscuribacterales bacterium]